MPQEKSFFGIFLTEITREILNRRNLFESLNTHLLEHSMEENAKLRLIKTIILVYSKTRFYNIAKKQTEGYR